MLWRSGHRRCLGRIHSQMIHVWYICLQNWVIYGVNVGKFFIYGWSGIWRAPKWMVHLPNRDQNLPESWPYSLTDRLTGSSLKDPANELPRARIIQVVTWINYEHWYIGYCIISHPYTSPSRQHDHVLGFWYHVSTCVDQFLRFPIGQRS